MNDAVKQTRPVYRVIYLGCVLTAVVLVLVGINVIFTYSGRASTADVVAQGKHRDCVQSLSTARRSVFDNVDIYKAIQIDQLSQALLAAQSGQKATPEVIAAFQANAARLHATLTEARRLQPSVTLDKLIDHGGMVAGRHYEACPT